MHSRGPHESNDIDQKNNNSSPNRGNNARETIQEISAQGARTMARKTKTATKQTTLGIIAEGLTEPEDAAEGTAHGTTVEGTTKLGETAGVTAQETTAQVTTRWQRKGRQPEKGQQRKV